jgi:hypothetical protein
VSRCRAGIHAAVPSRLSSSGSFAKSIAISRASSIVMMPVCRRCPVPAVENADLLPRGVLDGESVRQLDNPPRCRKATGHVLSFFAGRRGLAGAGSASRCHHRSGADLPRRRDRIVRGKALWLFTFSTRYLSR